jgi:formylglycine-generating enzyme required for sulfatase activity
VPDGLGTGKIWRNGKKLVDSTCLDAICGSQIFRKSMKSTIHSVFGLALLVGVSLVGSAVAAVNINYVHVGNPGNANDTTGFGGVAYEYKVAQNETTVGDYVQFLNAVAKSDPYALYNPSMGSDSVIAGITRTGSSGSYSYAPVAGSVNKPITYVSWFDAARFSNWMHNGQGSGSTETGAYTLNGAMSGVYSVNPGAQAWIPTENEWYKAAYYDATKGGTGGYWPYATQSNTLAGNDIGVPNSANYYDNGYAVYTGSGAGIWTTSDVGAYGPNSDSFYGTNDQGGNVWEWNDAIFGGATRGLRGSAWGFFDPTLASDVGVDADPTTEDHFIGFRVATVPEPGSAILTLLAGGLLLVRRKR